MLARAPESWKPHAEKRFGEAIDLDLVAKYAALRFETAVTWLPDDCLISDPRLITVDTPIRALCSSAQTAVGWQPRQDLLSDGAAWLSERGKDNCLICEAGLSRVGDSALKKRQFLTHRGKPFLWTALAPEKKETIALYLRWARGQRLLAVCGECHLSTSGPARALPLASSLFLCDVLDGDSLLAVQFDSLN